MDHAISTANSPLEDVKQPLSEQILERFVPSKFDDEEREFLPDGIIEELVTAKAIIKELNDTNSGDFKLQEESTKKHIVDFVLQHAKTVFAITLLCQFSSGDLEKVICHFDKIGFVDRLLPIKKGYLRDNSGETASLWTRLNSDIFNKYQWSFLAPVFSRKNFKFDLEPSRILPFIEKYCAESEKKLGAFGLVFEVEIHQAHHKDPILNDDGTRARLAIKEFIAPTNDETLKKDAEEVWTSEVDTLDQISGLRHEHLIQRIAAISRGKQRYLMFLWAEGGNLRDFWTKNPIPRMTPDLVKHIIQQLRGMADGTLKLHQYSSLRHFRHGDIKPENILIFPDRKGSTIGTFKISDFGAAKHHAVATRLRQQTAGKAFATIAYQPPEAVTNQLSASSRRYDIWSLGCVTLEFLVWILYGYQGLKNFDMSVKGDQGKPGSFFVATVDESTRGWVADVHPAVKNWLKVLSNHPECSGKTALGDLRQIVEEKLLIINLPADSESFSNSTDVSVTDTDAKSKIIQPFGKFRVSALGFVQALDGILQGEHTTDSSYWFAGRSPERIQQTPEIPRIITVNVASQQENRLGVNWNPEKSSPIVDRPNTLLSANVPNDLVFFPNQAQNILDLSPYWSYPVDNEFASHVVRDMGISVAPPNGFSASRLCDKCKNLDFITSRVYIEDMRSDLEKNRALCDFCRLRWEVSRHLDWKDYPAVSFEAKDSTLRMNDDASPALSICRSPDLQTTIPIQIGFPRLPGSRTERHFMMLRHWLKNCDDNHQELRCQPSGTTSLPTRLIDVGHVGSETVRLYETKTTDSFRYLALSHPWGKAGPWFCTFTKDVERYKSGIKTTDLTATFQDAVKITRELGVQYLWIDSICIIQRDASGDGDFTQEAHRMANVFNSAYCVLAASSAQAQSEGFLNDRQGSTRDFVTFEERGRAPFYVCNFIDDFNRHVLEGPLNQRGWVLQERVLAHRTIYFTNNQTYWECGEGVRCETLTKMEKKLASFFADPNFPEKITSNMTNRGERIVFYEDLYRQYSRLDFSRWEDRPIAIAGLQDQLINDLKTRGGFGVFDDGQSLLRRSLLWQRGRDQATMKVITFPAERSTVVPTWSWMAYQGGIDFLELPLGGVDWEKDNIYSPWNPDPSEHYTTTTTNQMRKIEMRAVAREFDVHDVGTDEVLVVYDIPSKKCKSSLCIVMGRKANVGGADEVKPPEEARHYVLLISPKEGGEMADKIYERVGVGYMPGKCIKMNVPAPLKLVKVH